MKCTHRLSWMTFVAMPNVKIILNVYTNIEIVYGTYCYLYTIFNVFGDKQL